MNAIAERIALEADLPEEMPGHWDGAGGREIAVEYAGRTRDSLIHGDKSDLVVANGVFLADRHDLDLIVWQTAAKERIRWLSARLAALSASDAAQVLREVERVRADIINTAETANFMAGVPIEAAHQRERWPSEHDAGKTPFDWFWLIGYLAQKAADAAVRGDVEKAKHHTISSAAALANWHAALDGTSTAMRPGIDPGSISEAAAATRTAPVVPLEAMSPAAEAQLA